ncbi:MAG TPA: hypothetical protein PKI59_01130, partial [Candidatus Cloacimonadota bacterium]|nr:hypothetical protein [Candidatus Cloacimonadota bacterium]
MKKLVAIVLLLCLAGLIHSKDVSSASDQTRFPESGMDAVKEILTGFIALIPPQSIRDYGFYDIQELSEAKPGTPMQLCELDPQKALGLTTGESVMDVLNPTAEWFVPVHTASGIKAMLRLEDDGKGNFHGVSFGYVPLACGLQQ